MIIRCGCLLLLFCHSTVFSEDLAWKYQDMIMSSYTINMEYSNTLILPHNLGNDSYSGCLCRASADYKIVLCFGNYVCTKFPKVQVEPTHLRVITSVLKNITKSELSSYNNLKILEIEMNQNLQQIEPCSFLNMTKLEQMSISYNRQLRTLEQNTFEGLTNLRNLTLVNNGFTNILDLTLMFSPKFLPSLKELDLSRTNLEVIPAAAFAPMKGSLLEILNINCCQIESIHPDSLTSLTFLKHLNIAENEINSSQIQDLVLSMKLNDINLISLDISAMGFRRKPPRDLLETIAETNIKALKLKKNLFEFLADDTFPRMPNIEMLDLRRVSAISVGPNVFSPYKFPKLKVLLLGCNNLPGIHHKKISDQLLLLDLSNKNENSNEHLVFEIDKDTFVYGKNLIVMNLSYNRVKSIFNYTFSGLENLKVLNMQHCTLFHIGPQTFKGLKNLEVLNLANNPLIHNENMTSEAYEGLNSLKELILSNCGLRQFNDDENIFEMMPNIEKLILRSNKLLFITAEMLKPMKSLKVLDLSENLLTTWWKPLFLSSGVKPEKLYLTNNKITHFTLSMIYDISYILEQNKSVVIDFMNNVFVCDCDSMYKPYKWVEVKGVKVLNDFFAKAEFQCSSPDHWEDKRVAEYIESIKSFHCESYTKKTTIMTFLLAAPLLMLITIILLLGTLMYKYRTFIKYWFFLAKLYLGRKINNKTFMKNFSGCKYDAFISYSNDDRDFVLEMVTQLECNPPFFKVCFYERDFEIGSFISESIMSCLSESRFIILVISNSFVKSHWCRWETQLAEYHRLLFDRIPYDPLILIKIGEVNNKHLTMTLKFLLKTKVYHTWNEKDPKVFWNKLRSVLVKKE